jgi:hypothetical protein
VQPHGLKRARLNHLADRFDAHAQQGSGSGPIQQLQVLVNALLIGLNLFVSAAFAAYLSPRNRHLAQPCGLPTLVLKPVFGSTMGLLKEISRNLRLFCARAEWAAPIGAAAI